METFSALLAICAGNSPVSGEFPAQRPVTRSFDVLFDPALNKQLSKQLWGSWFETLSCSLWRHCNEYSGFSKRRVTQWSLFTRDPVEVLAWIINFIQLFTGHVITFPYWGSRETMSAKKRAHGRRSYSNTMAHGDVYTFIWTGLSLVEVMTCCSFGSLSIPGPSLSHDKLQWNGQKLNYLNLNQCILLSQSFAGDPCKISINEYDLVEFGMISQPYVSEVRYMILHELYNDPTGKTDQNKNF